MSESNKQEDDHSFSFKSSDRSMYGKGTYFMKIPTAFLYVKVLSQTDNIHFFIPGIK